MKKLIALLSIVVCLVSALTICRTADAQNPQLVSVRKIWDQSPHNAFTDLVRFNDRWFCVFREGMGHVSPDGAMRVITSTDGVTWESAALITSDNSDLRDAKITVTPDGRLMLCGAEALHDKSSHTHQSLAWFSDDGYSWSEKHEIGDPNFWLWRVTWKGDTAFGIGYGCGPEKSLRLYSSQDGRSFQPLVERLYDTGYPNETSIVFTDNTAFCLLRRDGNPNTGLIGISQPPFTQWQWKDLGTRIGGPHMVRLADGRFLAAVRLYDGKVRTSLCWIDPDQATLTECLPLPSGGDTSYAGMVLHDGQLWVSYYSSHEGKTNIYLAIVDLPPATVDIGSRRELFVDEELTDQLSGLELKMHQPIPQEVSLVCDAPWEGNISAYYILFADGDLFRMYYRGAHWDETEKRSTHAEVTCYAESRDGITWTKPSLGLFEFNDSKENNIVWAGENTHNFTPFKDTNPHCAAEATYKALAGSAVRWNGTGLIAYQSPDGINWSRMSDSGVLTDGDFDSQNLAFWCPQQGCYLAYYRKSRDRVRDIMVSSSTDFLNWSEPEFLEYGAASQEHLYTNAIQSYFRASHLYVGFPTRFQPTHQQVEPILMTSRDGRNFRRWSEPLIPIDAPEDRDGNRSNYMTAGLLQLPGQDQEMSVYATEAYYAGSGSRVRRFTFRTDGFVSLSSGAAGGEMVSRPLRFSGNQLRLNFLTADTGSIQVELQDPAGYPLPGFALADCPPLSGDLIDGHVTWSSGSDLSALAGEPVRVRFVMQNADLFAMQFVH